MSAATFIGFRNIVHHSLGASGLVLLQEVVGVRLQVQIARHQPFVLDENHVGCGGGNVADEVQQGQSVEFFPELGHLKTRLPCQIILVYAHRVAEDSGITPHHQLQYAWQEGIVEIVVVEVLAVGRYPYPRFHVHGFIDYPVPGFFNVLDCIPRTLAVEPVFAAKGVEIEFMLTQFPIFVRNVEENMHFLIDVCDIVLVGK